MQLSGLQLLPWLVCVISETANDDVVLSEAVVVLSDVDVISEELELPELLSFLAQEIRKILKQQK